jgi:hypothetical protein
MSSNVCTVPESLPPRRPDQEVFCVELREDHPQDRLMGVLREPVFNYRITDRDGGFVFGGIWDPEATRGSLDHWLATLTDALGRSPCLVREPRVVLARPTETRRARPSEDERKAAA